MMDKLYKVLMPDGTTPQRGDFVWQKPTPEQIEAGEPGPWLEIKGGKIVACERGLLCDVNGVLYVYERIMEAK